MADSIEPVDLPPHLAMFETMLATWNEAMLAATDQMFRFWCMPFCAPHHHAALFPFQLEIPEPFEDDEDPDLFA
ncbi:hypothetical protein [Alteraurantiacibacter aquimixticola]|uniref:Uncharacterized protein n=1 Tax=Alteraurantiacibacter aquimixticola TaxID=2489173 RepID=A0A4T3F668_9SPHN|nr:hypothetical protein [Alteraurantiacibacter aquimixticola]TIX51914.1 hypothetical protein E5222_05605 [Alteraurantiacibacter aquimixticola]